MTPEQEDALVEQFWKLVTGDGDENMTECARLAIRAAVAQEARQAAEKRVKFLDEVGRQLGRKLAEEIDERKAAEALAESYRKDAERWQYWRSHPENWNWSSSASLYVWKSPTKLDQDTDRLIAAIAGEPK